MEPVAAGGGGTCSAAVELATICSPLLAAPDALGSALPAMPLPPTGGPTLLSLGSFAQGRRPLSD